MLRRFVVAFITFVGLIVPGTFMLALLMAPPARPQPVEQPGCERTLAAAAANVAAMQARVKKLPATPGAETCSAARLYFLEAVKARAVTAVCRSGPERDRELGRLDADVEQINEIIAARCS